MKKGRTVIRDPDLRRLRALKMLEMKVTKSATYADIAKEFGVNEQTVLRTFNWAKKAKLLAQLEDKLLENLLPSAATAVEQALKDGDKVQEAGRLGLDLMKLLIPSMKKDKSGPSNPNEDLAKYIADLRNADDGDVIDGQVETDPERTLPAAETQSPPQGDAPSPGGISAGDVVEPLEP